jgi:hypothetical protein
MLRPTTLALAVLTALLLHGSAYGNGVFSTSNADPKALRAIGFKYGTVSAYRSNLDRFWAHRLKALVWLGGYSQETCSFSWSDAKIKQRIAEIKGHPAIYAYFVDDEPHAGPECPNTPRQVRARNALVKRLDPRTPTVITENRTSSFRALANTTDVMGLVIYPCTYRLNGCDWRKVPTRVKLAEEAGVSRYWGVTQAFGDDYYKKPTRTQLQRLINQWNATRAEQDLVYTWDCCSDPLYGLKDAPELWDAWRAENGR